MSTRRSSESSRWGNTVKGLASMGIGHGVAGFPVGVAQGYLGHRMLSQQKRARNITPDEIERLKKLLKTDAPIHMDRSVVPRRRGVPEMGTRPQTGVAYSRRLPKGAVRRIEAATGKKISSNMIVVSKDMLKPGIVAHELGHASNKYRVPGVRGLKILGGKFVGLLSLGAAGFADPESAASKYAPLGVLAGGAEKLYEEGRASTRGYRALKKLDVNKGALRAAKASMGRGFGTYAAGTVGAMGAAVLARKIRQILDSPKKK